MVQNEGMFSLHSLEFLVKQSTAQIAADYERMRELAKKDPGTSGDQGEEDWARVLGHWLPPTYQIVTKGRILTSNGRTSPQVDVLVLAPSYPAGLLNNKLYIASGVLAAFECKRTLRREHISKAVSAAAEIGFLARADPGIPHHIIYGLLAHSHKIASKRRPATEVLSGALVEEDQRYVHDPRDCLDFICVPGLGTWSLMRFLKQIDRSGSGVIATSYMGPLDPSNPPDMQVDAIGRFLTGLLRRLATTDKSLALIAQYFDNVGLFGTGQGEIREWTLGAIPDVLKASLW